MKITNKQFNCLLFMLFGIVLSLLDLTNGITIIGAVICLISLIVALVAGRKSDE